MTLRTLGLRMSSHRCVGSALRAAPRSSLVKEAQSCAHCCPLAALHITTRLFSQPDYVASGRHPRSILGPGKGLTPSEPLQIMQQGDIMVWLSLVHVRHSMSPALVCGNCHTENAIDWVQAAVSWFVCYSLHVHVAATNTHLT
jgi:hypothetical protein